MSDQQNMLEDAAAKVLKNQEPEGYWAGLVAGTSPTMNKEEISELELVLGRSLDDERPDLGSISFLHGRRSGVPRSLNQ